MRVKLARAARRAAVALAVGLSLAALRLDAQPPANEDELARLRREQSGKNPPAASEVAQRLDHVALAFLGRGEVGRAIELLSEAFERDPTNSSALTHLTLAYARNGDLDFARSTLDLAAALPDAPAAPFCEIGSVYVTAHRLDDAMTAWEVCRRLGGPAASFAASLEAARAEMSVMSRTRSLESGRFTIVADARISEALLQRVADHLTAEDSRPDKFLKTGSVVAQVVVLYAGRTFFTLVSIPEWVSGVFDGKIRIAVDPFAPSNPALDSVLTHELTHAAVRELSRDRAPGWLQEGLAQWREGRRLTRHDLQRLFSGRALIPLADLETRFARADLEAARTSYAEALGLVEFLLAERGEGAIRCVLTDLAGGAAIDSALSAETGWNAAALLDAWARWAAIQGPQPAPAR